jgi:hypothetical protein
MKNKIYAGLLIFIAIIVLLTFLDLKSGSWEAPYYEPHYSRKIPLKRESYRKDRSDCSKINLKLGQRKLFNSELEFFLEHLVAADVVVYAGSAPGSHSVVWPQIWPRTHFIFYDPNAFDPGLEKFTNMELHQEYFTEDICLDLRKKHPSILFLSDIRTGSSTKNVELDMNIQKKWCMALKPRMAMLKFRLPWKSGKTTYFKGDIYLQVRAPNNSTETRLWTDCSTMQEWDNDAYNDRIFYFQNYCRAAWHQFDLPAVEGIDHCYDCWAETQIYGRLALFLGKSIEEIFIMEKTSIKIAPHGLMREERDTAKKIRELCPITLKYLAEKDRREKLRDTTRRSTTFAEKLAALMEEYGPLLKQTVPILNVTFPVDPLYLPLSILPENRLPLRSLHPWEDTKYYDLGRALMVTCGQFLQKTGARRILINTHIYDQWVARLATIFPQTVFIIYFGTHKYIQPMVDNLVFLNKKLSTAELGELDLTDLYYVDTAEDWRPQISPVKSLLWVKVVSGLKTLPAGTMLPMPYVDKLQYTVYIECADNTNKTVDAGSLREQIFYHDVYCRDAYFEHSEERLDHCFSCHYEISFWNSLGMNAEQQMLRIDRGLYNHYEDYPHREGLGTNTYQSLRRLEPAITRYADLRRKIEAELYLEKKLN